jgi:hypothetical protein
MYFAAKLCFLCIALIDRALLTGSSVPQLGDKTCAVMAMDGKGAERPKFVLFGDSITQQSFRAGALEKVLAVHRPCF